MKPKLLIELFLFILFLSLQTLVALASNDARPAQIFEVHKKLQMTSQDPIVRDYYMNAGANAGLKEGALVTVLRKIPLNDPTKLDIQDHIDIPVGAIKIIYADKTVCIGRLESVRKNGPVLDSETFMVGDFLDLSSLHFAEQDSKKQSETAPDLQEQQTAEAPEEAPQEKPAKALPKKIDKVTALPHNDRQTANVLLK